MRLREQELKVELVKYIEDQKKHRRRRKWEIANEHANLGLALFSTSLNAIYGHMWWTVFFVCISVFWWQFMGLSKELYTERDDLHTKLIATYHKALSTYTSYDNVSVEELEGNNG